MPSMTVFINGTARELPAGSSVLDAVRAADPAEAEAIERGERVTVDSRGLATDHLAPAYAGAIYRTQRARPAPG